MIDETSHRYLVELTGAPTTEGGNESSLKQEKDSFRGRAKAAGISIVTGTEYQDLFNGMAVEATPAQARALSRLDGVLSLTPVNVIPAPTGTPTTPLDPELYTALAQTGADVVQSELGYTGRGIKVAVMDTGIDYDHPALGGCFGPGCRVATGWDFVGDAYNADDTSPSYNPVPTPDPYPDDCAGHGSHVAGIIGANGGKDGLHGVAPDVTFGSYRVFGCEGSTTDEIMMAAMERALKDHMDVLNMSIGAAFTWPQSPTGKAASRLVKKGMVVVASIGNSGASGLFSAGAPGLGEDVIGVASVENTNVFLNSFTISPDNKAIGYQGATGAPTAPTSGGADVVKLANPIGCTASGISENLTGKIALIRRGTCTFAQKAANAQAKGAIGVILYNSIAGRFSPTVVGTVPITIPVVSITLADGNVMVSRLSAGPVTLTWTADGGSFPNPGGNMISSFSSYGLGPDLSLKPDIAAPGGNIYSTYPLELGGYATLSGTSMSSPHVAGAVALLLQANPRLRAGEVRSILQNAAIPQLWSLDPDPDSGLLDSVNRQGAGLLRIDDAILNTTTISPGKIAVGESQAGPKTVQLEIKNNGSRTVTYTLSNVDGVSPGGNTFNPTFKYADTLVTYDKGTVTVKPHQSVKVKATITPPGPGQMDTYQYGGWIVATPDDNGPKLRVPYAGYVGDYQAIQVLTPTPDGLPGLAKVIGGSYQIQPSGATFSMTGDDVANILLHLNHQSTLMRADVMNATTGSYVGKAWPDETYLARNSTPTGFFAWAWDGLVTRSGEDTGNHENDDQEDKNHKPKATPVPAGQYVIKISILKAGGDKRNPAHWETWTTPTITVTRP